MSIEPRSCRGSRPGPRWHRRVRRHRPASRKQAATWSSLPCQKRETHPASISDDRSPGIDATWPPDSPSASNPSRALHHRRTRPPGGPGASLVGHLVTRRGPGPRLPRANPLRMPPEVVQCLVRVPAVEGRRPSGRPRWRAGWHHRRQGGQLMNPSGADIGVVDVGPGQAAVNEHGGRRGDVPCPHVPSQRLCQIAGLLEPRTAARPKRVWRSAGRRRRNRYPRISVSRG